MSRTILIVEDHVGGCRPLARLLESQGYETVCAENGEAAMEALRRGRPELVLLDLMMPVMGGVEFLKVLRHNPAWEDLPVIVLTAKPPQDDAVLEARRLGARECFTKASYTLDQLLTSIRRHLAA